MLSLSTPHYFRVIDLGIRAISNIIVGHCLGSNHHLEEVLYTFFLGVCIVLLRHYSLLIHPLMGPIGNGQF